MRSDRCWFRLQLPRRTPHRLTWRAVHSFETRHWHKGATRHERALLGDGKKETGYIFGSRFEGHNVCGGESLECDP